jgi:hypothetical protein
MKLGLESVKNKREEVSSFLDESSFIHSYLCGAASSNQPHFHVQPHFVCNQQQENLSPNTDISAVISDQHLSLLHIKQPQLIQYQQKPQRLDTIRDDSENTMEGGADTLARDITNYQDD